MKYYIKMLPFVVFYLLLISVPFTGYCGSGPAVPSRNSSVITGMGKEDINTEFLGTCGPGMVRNDRILYNLMGDLYTIKPDGTDDTRLTRYFGIAPSNAKCGRWSHDGKKIVYAMGLGEEAVCHPQARYDIHVMTVGGEDVNITEDLPDCYQGGDFSPNDSEIVFYGWPRSETMTEPFDSTFTIFTRGISGESGARRISSFNLGTTERYGGRALADPLWCSQNVIAWMGADEESYEEYVGNNVIASHTDTNNYDILDSGTSSPGSADAKSSFHHINCNTSDGRILWSKCFVPRDRDGLLRCSKEELRWSPYPHTTAGTVNNRGIWAKGVFNKTGSKIAYFDEEGPGGIRALFVADSNGRDPLNLSATCNEARLRRTDYVYVYDFTPPSWSPDEKEIVFGAANGIFVAKVDGSECRRLVRTQATCPQWSPLRCIKEPLQIRQNQSDIYKVKSGDKLLEMKKK